ncbi:right-handed parallel beta-helix repeat-containing protein [Tundrisphaera sp. TA3]|uniref:right-handed parallel beta-helix repeat-containing protein n=1 Tax=Tundrisphaera sp. TA3 TaxID=3435775 RepID=UPI003EBDD333
MARITFAPMALAFAALMAAPAEGQEIVVRDIAGLRREIAGAKPGSVIRVAPGVYEGGVSARGLHGKPGSPIAIRAADPKEPPTFRGGASAFHLAAVSHLELADLVVEGATGNGINIDDGGKAGEPSHHVVLRGLVVRDVGPKGNRDGIKLSGLDDFRVEGCTVERWGDRGSGIDMVGCHRGEIVGCTFHHGDKLGDHGVQTKGGSAEIAIRRCRFDHAGQRAVNLGGSTGLPYFRPQPAPGYEAKAITVEDCTFLGSMAPVAFVGVDGATVRHNTIYRPKRWGLRILQETKADGFAPCRNGAFSDNLIAFRSDEMAVPINVGPGTAPDSFTLARNAWYCLDAPARSRPKLPIPEADGVYGEAPGFRDAEAGDLRSAGPAGARPDQGASGEARP